MNRKEGRRSCRPCLPSSACFNSIREVMRNNKRCFGQTTAFFWQPGAPVLGGSSAEHIQYALTSINLLPLAHCKYRLNYKVIKQLLASLHYHIKKHRLLPICTRTEVYFSKSKLSKQMGQGLCSNWNEICINAIVGAWIFSLCGL